MGKLTEETWRVGVVGDGYVFGDECVPGTPVEAAEFTVALALGDATSLDHEAHAKLIAAAPDLLAAAIATEALDDRDDCEECGGEGEPEMCPLCFPKADDARIMRRNAIRKATA